MKIIFHGFQQLSRGLRIVNAWVLNRQSLLLGTVWRSVGVPKTRKFFSSYLEHPRKFVGKKRFSAARIAMRRFADSEGVVVIIFSGSQNFPSGNVLWKPFLCWCMRSYVAVLRTAILASMPRFGKTWNLGGGRRLFRAILPSFNGIWRITASLFVSKSILLIPIENWQMSPKKSVRRLCCAIVWSSLWAKTGCYRASFCLAFEGFGRGFICTVSFPDCYLLICGSGSRKFAVSLPNDVNSCIARSFTK